MKNNRLMAASLDASTSPRSRFAGFAIAEVAIAGAILGILLTLVGQFLVQLELAETQSTRQANALRLLENRLEQALVEVRRTGQLSEPMLDPEERKTFPGAQLTVERSEPDNLGFVGVTMSLRWRTLSGEFTAPVVLTAWMPAAEAVSEARETPR